MSKLDDITLMFVGGLAASLDPIEGLEAMSPEQVRLHYKQQVKNLVLEIAERHQDEAGNMNYSSFVGEVKAL